MRICYFLFLLTAIFSAGSGQAQRNPTALKPEKGKAIIDTEIAASAGQVSSDSIREYIVKLSSFGTRHSLSDTLSETAGIGAARRWVAYKFRQFARREGADLHVTLDPYTISPGPRTPRVPYQVTMKNVLGTLSGNDPNDPRVILISGHLDSRNSDIMDATGMAPGANDDASGVAVVLELARVLSAKK